MLIHLKKFVNCVYIILRGGGGGSLRSKRSGTKRTKFWPRVLVFLPSGRAKNGARAKS